MQNSNSHLKTFLKSLFKYLFYSFLWKSHKIESRSQTLQVIKKQAGEKIMENHAMENVK